MKKILTLLYIATFSINTIANSAMIFPQRVILDGKTKVGNFKIINPGNQNTQYSIDLVDRVQDTEGRTTQVDNYEFTAKNNLIYTPRKKIKLDANGRKPIRVKAKNIGALEDGEYRTYLNIVTDDPEPTSEKTGYHVGLRTGIQLPVIIRKGQLNAKSTISIKEIKDNKAIVQLNRTGNRSIFGNIEIIQNNIEIGTIKGVAIYVESNGAAHTINLKSYNPNEQITIKFIEEELSGDAHSESIF